MHSLVAFDLQGNRLEWAVDFYGPDFICLKNKESKPLQGPSSTRHTQMQLTNAYRTETLRILDFALLLTFKNKLIWCF